jgi:uncharacterized protein YjbI with pentapeptide repeats
VLNFLSNISRNWVPLYVGEAPGGYKIFPEADLIKADLYGADLRGANLSGANLRGADLRGAILCDCNLDGVIISYRSGVRRVRFEEV